MRAGKTGLWIGKRCGFKIGHTKVVLVPDEGERQPHPLPSGPPDVKRDQVVSEVVGLEVHDTYIAPDAAEALAELARQHRDETGLKVEEWRIVW